MLTQTNFISSLWVHYNYLAILQEIFLFLLRIFFRPEFKTNYKCQLKSNTISNLFYKYIYINIGNLVDYKCEDQHEN